MENVTLEEFTTSTNLLAQALTVQTNRDVVASLVGGMSSYRITKFLRMNPSKYSGSKVEEYSNGFIDEVYKNLFIIGFTSREKAELASYQLKDVAHVWYDHCIDYRSVGSVPQSGKILNCLFLIGSFLGS